MEDLDVGARLQEFLGRTGCSDVDQALSLLEAHDWDVDAAASVFAAQNAPRTREPVVPPRQSVASPRQAAAQGGTASAQPANGEGLGTSILSALPSFIQRGVQIVGGIAGSLLSPIIGSVQNARPDSGETFTAYFERNFGRVHPIFYPGSSERAIMESERTSKLLFIYLHSPSHADTSAYCREVLGNPDIVQLLNNNFICWGGNIQDADGYALASHLLVDGYPFVAVISVGHVNQSIQMQVLARVSGYTTAAVLAEGLQRVLEEHSSLQAAVVASQEEQSSARQLREEQDRAYEAALQADLQRQEEERRTERILREEQERQRREETQRQQVEEQRATRVQDFKSRCAALTPNQDGVCVLRIRMPNGPLQITVKQSETMDIVYDFAAHEGKVLAGANFCLCTNIPPAEYGREKLVRDVTQGAKQVQLFFKEK
eukprot:ANDGO_06717.mRNA.1 Plant UBX domain-containing protein 10